MPILWHDLPMTQLVMMVMMAINVVVWRANEYRATIMHLIKWLRNQLLLKNDQQGYTQWIHDATDWQKSCHEFGPIYWLHRTEMEKHFLSEQ